MNFMNEGQKVLINRLADTYTDDEIRDLLIEHLWNEYQDELTKTLEEDVEQAERNRK